MRNKKYDGLLLIICTLAVIVLTGIGTSKVEASYLSEDLDGDGKKDTIEWEMSGDFEYYLDNLTINGIDVYEQTEASHPLYSEFVEFEVYTADTCTKDKYKELIVKADREPLLNIYRYRKGKIYKPITISGEKIISQEKKNCIKVLDWVYVRGFGKLYTEIEYKIKANKTVVKTKSFKADNFGTRVFKSTRKMNIYEDTSFKKEVGTLKSGQVFKTYKFRKDENGEFTRIYIMTKDGVKGWINTKNIDEYYIVDNPQLWG